MGDSQISVKSTGRHGTSQKERRRVFDVAAEDTGKYERGTDEVWEYAKDHCENRASQENF